jgi:hypothetical protein
MMLVFFKYRSNSAHFARYFLAQHYDFLSKTSLTKATLSFIFISVRKAIVLRELDDKVVPVVFRASTVYFSMEAGVLMASFAHEFTGRNDR